MAWRFLESMILSSQWKVSDYTTGNLFKIIHTCSFPADFAWKYKGLIGQSLNDSDTGNLQLFGDIQQLYFDPPNQFVWFNPLDNIDLRRIACKGYYSSKTSFSWIVQIYEWDELISASTQLSEVVEQQLALLAQQEQLLNEIYLQTSQILNTIASLPSGGGNANNSGGGGGNGAGGGNPNFGF